MMSEPIKEFPIHDKHGNKVLVVKLIEGRSEIFMGNDKEPFMSCHYAPISIPTKEFSEYGQIESINDLIDELDSLLESTMDWESALIKKS